MHGLDDEAVVFAAEGLEHADEVAGVGDGGTEAFADRLMVGAVAEVVVAAGVGHADGGALLRRYGHLYKGARKQAALALEDHVLRASAFSVGSSGG